MESRWLFSRKPTVEWMKGHLLVSHRILDCCLLAQVFVSNGPLFGVNEESISAVSLKNLKEREEIFIWNPLFWKLALFSSFLSIDWAWLWARILFFKKFDFLSIHFSRYNAWWQKILCFIILTLWYLIAWESANNSVWRIFMSFKIYKQFSEHCQVVSTAQDIKYKKPFYSERISKF